MNQTTKTAMWMAVLVVGFFQGGLVVADDLPSRFVQAGLFTFSDKAPHNVGTGIPSIEIGPDGKLWLFEPFVRKDNAFFSPGEIQVINPVDGVFFNGNDRLSVRFGDSKNGAVFTPDGKLMTFATKWSRVTLRDPIDQTFFNDDDQLDTLEWAFGALHTVGTPEPSPAAMSPTGILYFTIPTQNQLAVFDMQDGNLSNEHFSFAQVDLLPEIYGHRPMGIAFNPAGHLFLASRNYQFGTTPDGQPRLGPAIIGLQSVDGNFFNDDDVIQVYDLESMLSGVTLDHGSPLITDIAFDRHGNLFVFDARYEQLYQFTPAGL